MTIVQNCLFCGLHPRARSDVFSSIQVAAESREIAAADVEAKTMSRHENVTHRTESHVFVTDTVRIWLWPEKASENTDE